MNQAKLIMVLLISILLLSGCSLLQVGNTTKTPTPYFERKLLTAVEYDRLEMAKEAIAEGANIDQFQVTAFKKSGEIEKNPLFVALDMAAFNTAEYLIEKGADLNSYRNPDGDTCLTYFCDYHYWQCKRFIPLLLENGADPSLTDKEGHDAVENMIMLSDFSDKYLKEMIHLMIQHGAIIDKDTIQICYKYFSCEMLPELTHSLVKSGKDTGLSNFKQNIILGKSDKVKEELSEETMKNYDEEEILLLITAICDSKTLEKCIKVIDFDETYRDPLLVIASRSGNLDNVKYLVKLGANINYETEDNRTPLLWAIYNDHLALLSIYLTIMQH